MAVERREVTGSERVAPNAPSVGAVDPTQTATISLYVKSKTTAPEPGAARIIGRAALKSERETALAATFARLSAFAAAHNLKVVETEPGRRLMKVSGTIADLSAAFGANLALYEHGANTFRGRTGSLSAPADVADDLEAVLGLDQRPIATPKLVRTTAAQVNSSFLPNAVASIYGFPTTRRQGRVRGDHRAGRRRLSEPTPRLRSRPWASRRRRSSPSASAAGPTTRAPTRTPTAKSRSMSRSPAAPRPARRSRSISRRTPTRVSSTPSPTPCTMRRTSPASCRSAGARPRAAGRSRRSPP